MLKNSTLLYITAYLLLVMAVWFLFSLTPQPEVFILEEQSGVLDLSGADFTDTVYYYLDNYWESYPETLLTPEDLAEPAASSSLQMQFEDFQSVQYATHRLDIKLPEGEVYAITMKTSDYAMRIYIDGEEVDCVGKPGASAKENVPRTAYRTYYFQSTGEVNTIVVQASNWVHQEGAFAPNFYVGKASNIDAHNSHTRMMTFFITGSLITAFLYHLSLFLLNRKRLPTLVFAISCLLLAMMNNPPLQLLFSEYNWYVTFRMEYIVHYFTFAALALFLDLLFPRLLHRFITRTYYAMTVLYTLVTLVTPTTIFSRLLIGFEAASVLMIVYILIRLGIQLGKKKPQNSLAFLGILVVSLFGVNDILGTNQVTFLGHIANQFFTTPIAMLFFVFCYGLVLSLEYAETERVMLLARESERSLAADNAALNRLGRLRNDLIATVSHETRTPLAVLSGYAELISMELRKKGVDEQAACDLDNIAVEAQRIGLLMDELQQMTMQRDEDTGKTRLELSGVIEAAARMYQPILLQKGDILKIDLPEDLPAVYASAGEMTQVLFNLLQNARNYTENGQIHIRAWTEKDFVVVELADTGAGIPAELLPHIFERGISGHEDGNGLGLTICKEIIEGHGGSVKVKSESGKGTSVRFMLPVYGKENGYGNSLIS